MGPSNRVAPSAGDGDCTHEEHEGQRQLATANGQSTQSGGALGRSLKEAFLQSTSDFGTFSPRTEDPHHQNGTVAETIQFLNGHSQAEAVPGSSSRQCATIVAKCMLFQHNDLQPSFWLFIQKYKRALNEDAGTVRLVCFRRV